MQPLLREAYELLEKGGRQQASEKAWAAVAHRLIEVADQCDIPLETHQQLYDVQRVLVEEYSDPRHLSLLFINAHSMHKDYHVDCCRPASDLRWKIDRTAELLDILEA